MSLNPILTGVAALATGAWFVSAAGGFAAAGAKLGALASKAVGSISTGWAPASSGIGGTFSLKVGSFASLNAGAGISGTSAFASANVSIFGLPIAGVGKSVGALGRISDPFASSLVGNFSDAVSSNLLNSGGSIQVGSFLQSVGRNTATGYVNGQFAQTGIPTAIGAVSQARQFAGDVYGAFSDVFAPPTPRPVPIAMPVQAVGGIGSNATAMPETRTWEFTVTPEVGNWVTNSSAGGTPYADYFYAGIDDLMTAEALGGGQFGAIRDRHNLRGGRCPPSPSSRWCCCNPENLLSLLPGELAE